MVGCTFYQTFEKTVEGEEDNQALHITLSLITLLFVPITVIDVPQIESIIY